MDEQGLQDNPQNPFTSRFSYKEFLSLHTNALAGIARDNLKTANQADTQELQAFFNNISLPFAAVLACNALVKVAMLAGTILDTLALETHREVLERLGKADEIDATIGESLRLSGWLEQLVNGYVQAFEADKWERLCKAYPTPCNLEALDIIKRVRGFLFQVKDNFLSGMEHPAAARIRGNIKPSLSVYEVPYLVFPKQSPLDLAGRFSMQEAIRRAIQGEFLPVQGTEAYSGMTEEQQLTHRISLEAFNTAARDGWIFYRATDAAGEWLEAIQQRQHRRMKAQGLLPGQLLDEPKSQPDFSTTLKTATRLDLQVQALLSIRATLPANATRKQVHAECQRQRPELFSIGFEGFKKIWNASNKVG